MFLKINTFVNLFSGDKNKFDDLGRLCLPAPDFRGSQITQSGAFTPLRRKYAQMQCAGAGIACLRP